jgi:hypothetical protein
MDQLAFFRRLNRKISRIPVFLSEEIDEEFQNYPLILHIQNYPKLRWKDVYKFLMQGACGWAHLKSIGKTDRVQQYLQEEFRSVGEPLPQEDLYELLNEETQLVRLNLKVWKSRFSDKPDQIWELMVSALEKLPNDVNLFLTQWLKLIELYEKGIIKINQNRKRKYGRIFHWLNFVLELISDSEKVSDIPLLHHSKIYRNYYQPSYRLVMKDDLLKILEKSRKEMV